MSGVRQTKLNNRLDGKKGGREAGRIVGRFYNRQGLGQGREGRKINWHYNPPAVVVVTTSISIIATTTVLCKQRVIIDNGLRNGACMRVRTYHVW